MIFRPWRGKENIKMILFKKKKLEGRGNRIEEQ
jgi:hypothetical protein